MAVMFHAVCVKIGVKTVFAKIGVSVFLMGVVAKIKYPGILIFYPSEPETSGPEYHRDQIPVLLPRNMGRRA